jgi:hypothetical protein
MIKPKGKRKGDVSQVTYSVMQDFIKMSEKPVPPPPPEKNPAAVALGRLGGLKGGKARAEKLSKQKRSEIAQKAAEMRWKKQKRLQK